MFCPQCGQQQVSGVVRFCSRCGFPLDGVIHLLSNAGMMPIYRAPEEAKELSPRRKGVRQGGILFLSGVLIVPILGVLSSYAPTSNFLAILLAFAAIICFVGGPLRMLYAALFEEGAPNPYSVAAARQFTPAHRPAPQFGAPMQHNALPPPSAQSASGWRPRPITAELVTPPSVTENTTRLLDKEDRKEH
jgi:hypothetical protein